jgi:hypothetical protein
MATTGYHKGPEKEKKASAQEKVRGGPSPSAGKYKDSGIRKGKVVYNTGGPEDDPSLILRGTATTQRMRYDLGTKIVPKGTKKKSRRGS